MPHISLPVGIEEFQEIRKKNCYFVDKTHLIEELLKDRFKVMLFTRPRRFGKTLAMSMLAAFFDIRMDSAELFAGLTVSDNKELCAQWRNQYPVLFVTLKNIGGRDFGAAYEMLKDTISDLCVAHSYLQDSLSVNEKDRKTFGRLMNCEGSETQVRGALYTLLRMMSMHYKKPAILLLDEYDAPLAGAYENGYYEEMLDQIRGFIGKALKTNEYLNFAVVTGCLRIAKESVFTGTNNFVSNSILRAEYSDCFGFTETDVERLLVETGFLGEMNHVRQWYDGYRFGETEIYCPWDVVNHVRALQSNPSARPENYWRNTSHNGIIRSFIERADLAVQDKFEVLLSGGCIRETILEDMTYDTLHSSEANLWSILYLTGYLTQAGFGEAGEVRLKIPNEEIKTIFADTIRSWFGDTVEKMDRRPLFQAFWNGLPEEASRRTGDILFDTISYFDYKEDYYHVFLTGLFAGAGYAVESNREYGLGRPDLVIRDKKNRRILILEVKHSHSAQAMEQDCLKAFAQIDVGQYARQFLGGYQTVLCYGVAFYKKECLVKMAERLSLKE